jgi:hypothetical protein
MQDGNCCTKDTDKECEWAEFWWLTPVILATWEAEIRRIMLWGQPGEKGSQDPISTEKAGVLIYACHVSYCRKFK